MLGSHIVEYGPTASGFDFTSLQPSDAHMRQWTNQYKTII